MNEKNTQQFQNINQKLKDAINEAERNGETGEIIIRISILTGGITNVFITKSKKI
jgi:outer membrane biosynthesis protein TonB